MKKILAIVLLAFMPLVYADHHAQKESTKTGKPILANFTGTDWCGWCIRLKNEVFVTEEFKTWSAKNVVLLELDFPRQSALAEDLTAQNRQLQQVFQVSGYPTLFIFDLSLNKETKQFNIAPRGSNISSLGRFGYVAGGPSEWIKAAEERLKNKL